MIYSRPDGGADQAIGDPHRPARHSLEVDGRACERWVLPDWYERGGYLLVDDAGPRLVSF